VESFRHRDEVAELAQVNVRHDLPLMPRRYHGRPKRSWTRLLRTRTM
jgi:hypothetical protein